jgi:hypothetical protein
LTEFYPHLYDCTILRQYFYISFAERLWTIAINLYVRTRGNWALWE